MSIDQEIDRILLRHKEWLKYHDLKDKTALEVSTAVAAPGVKANLRGALLDGRRLRNREMTGADMAQASFIETDFTNSDLIAANLSGCNLTRANLICAQLREADLSGANLTGANLKWANLQFARLDGADLTGAELSYAIGDGRHIKNFQPGSGQKWWATYTATHLAIGCHQYPIERWLAFTDDEIRIIEPEAAWKWVTHKTLLFDLLKQFPAEACGG